MNVGKAFRRHLVQNSKGKQLRRGILRVWTMGLAKVRLLEKGLV